MEMDEFGMIDWSLHGGPDWSVALYLVGYLTAGFGLGMLYFHALRRSADLLATGGRAWTAAALTLGRLALAGAMLTFAGMQGAAPLLAMALGFLIARSCIMRRALKATP